MCGIVGVAGPLDGPRIGEAVGRMLSAVAHRGPDGEGRWLGPGFGFGAARLSIIDLVGGRQPMWDEKRGTGIVYNGEVYNYRALRSRLQDEGERFDTASDTEVVLRSLGAKGLDAVHEWNGMFAMAWWDPAGRKLTLIRDRLGVKPLYYFWDGSCLVFASETKALLRSGLMRPTINRQSLWDYLTFRYVPGCETIWENVFKLPPGHVLEWWPGRPPDVRRYWSTDVSAAVGEVALAEALGQFEQLLLSAVELRLVASDVPVGVLLSGGLDSSSVAAAAIELGHRRFHTFSVGFQEGGRFSEFPYARAMARHIGAEHHEVTLTRADFVDLLPEAVRAADEPLADLSAIPLLAVSRLARGWVKVVLSGEGADEVLGGYDLDRAVRRWRFIGRLQALPAALLVGLAAPLSRLAPRRGATIERIARLPLARWNREHRVHMTRHWDQASKRRLWPAFEGRDSDHLIDDLYAGATSDDPLEQVLSVLQRSWLVEDLLMKADKMSMAASLELRVPYLDYRLVEWANRLPPAMKVRRTRAGVYVTKYVLRRFAECRLPSAVLGRAKQGFPVPAYEWLRDGAFARWAEDALTGRESRLARTFSVPVMRDELGRARGGDMEAAHRTWVLLVLEWWLRGYGPSVEAG